jgi:hypothetical protein
VEQLELETYTWQWRGTVNTYTWQRYYQADVPARTSKDIPAIIWSSRHIFGLLIVASVREGKGVRQQTKDAASTPPPLPFSGRQPSASIMLKRYDVDHPKAQRHPLFTLLGHSAPPASSVGRCYAFIVGSAGHEFASPLIVDATDDDDAAAVTVQAACASTKF